MKTKEKITLAILIVLYCLASIRYFPGNPPETVYATLRHLLSAIPFVIGLTLFTVVIVQKMAGNKMAKDRVVRIYLMFGLVTEFFYALYQYLGQGG